MRAPLALNEKHHLDILDWRHVESVVEPDKMTPEQRATITELQRALSLSRESLGLLRHEITNKPTSGLMTFTDADNLITALRARERHD
jgi:hypothetical protein